MQTELGMITLGLIIEAFCYDPKPWETPNLDADTASVKSPSRKNYFLLDKRIQSLVYFSFQNASVVFPS